MKHTRIIVTRYGGPDALELLEEECPEPKDDEVRVRVLAAGVSLPDVLMREGVHPETPALPFSPGWDLVGVVDRLGKGVSGITAGRTVAALPISGAYAEFVCLPERELVPVPSQLDAAERVLLAGLGDVRYSPRQRMSLKDYATARFLRNRGNLAI